MQTIRHAAVAGMFYPASASKLEEELHVLFDAAKEQKPSGEKIFGIIVPHAGYIYSGQTAAHAYSKIKGMDFKTVIVISPSHREYFPGVCVYDGEAYETPLGLIPIDKEKVSKLSEGSRIIFKGNLGHKQEHALEVQLPFLQTVLDDFSLVPVVIGDQSRNFLFELSDRLTRITDDKTLIVASSDLSHFHSKKEADKLDSIIEQRINSFDYEGLLRDLEDQKCEACGGGPIVALMRTSELLNRKKARVIHRSDSGDVTGDSHEVVGYLSAVIYE